VNWQKEKLGELCHIELGKTPSRSNKKLWDEAKKSQNIWLSIADLPHSFKPIISDSKEYISEEGRKLCKLVPRGTLILSFKLSIGRLAFAGKDLYTNEAIAALYIVDSALLVQDYLYWYLKFFDWDIAVGNDVKVKGKTLNKAKLKEVDVFFPSIQEQKRIVTILDQAFANIEKARVTAETNLKNARELFDSYLQQVFSQRGEGWELKKVSEIADTCLGKMLDKKKNKGSPKPYLRNLNVQWFDITLSDIQEMRFEESEVERYSIKKGDLVICEGGYPGRGAIWQQEGDIFFQKALHRVRCHSKIYNEWILYFIYLSDRNGNLKNSFTGAGIQHFTGKALKNLTIPIPQESVAGAYVKKIVKLQGKIWLLENVYKQKIDKLEELKRAILQKAFSCELTKNKVEAA
jgi:type I restriction enzyme S subunit